MLTIAFLFGLVALPLYAHRNGVGVAGLFATTTLVVLTYELIVVASFALFKVTLPIWINLRGSIWLFDMPWELTTSGIHSTSVHVWAKLFPALVWGFLALTVFGLTYLRAPYARQVTTGCYWILLAAFVVENAAYIVLSLLLNPVRFDIADRAANWLVPASGIADFIAFGAFLSLLALFSRSLWRRVTRGPAKS